MEKMERDCEQKAPSEPLIPKNDIYYRYNFEHILRNENEKVYDRPDKRDTYDNAC